MNLSGISDEEFYKELSRRNLAKRSSVGGRPKKLTRCPKCGERMGARDLRNHKPSCTGERTNMRSFENPDQEYKYEQSGAKWVIFERAYSEKWLPVAECATETAASAIHAHLAGNINKLEKQFGQRIGATCIPRCSIDSPCEICGGAGTLPDERIPGNRLLCPNLQKGQL